MRASSPGWSGDLDGDHVGLARREALFLEQLDGLVRLVGDHAQDAEVGGVGDRDGAQVDAGLRATARSRRPGGRWCSP